MHTSLDRNDLFYAGVNITSRRATIWVVGGLRSAHFFSGSRANPFSEFGKGEAEIPDRHARCGTLISSA
jgi:hypothetical protein